MKKVQTYLSANQLALNVDKAKVMLVCNDERVKKNFTIELNGKTVLHSQEVKILCNVMSESLTWDSHVHKEVLPALHNWVQTLRIMSCYLDPKV